MKVPTSPRERMKFDKLRAEATIGRKAKRLFNEMGLTTWAAFELVVREKFGLGVVEKKTPPSGSQESKVVSRSIPFAHGVKKYASENHVDPTSVKTFVLDSVKGDVGSRKVEKPDVDAYLRLRRES